MFKKRNNQFGEGTTEYIVILTVFLGFFLLVFWTTIRNAIYRRLNMIGSNIQLVSKNPGKTTPAEETSSGSSSGSSESSTGGGLMGGSGSISYGSTAEISTGPATSNF